MPKKVKSFDQESYEKISLANLILFAINLITEDKEKFTSLDSKHLTGCTFEKLIKECFTLFPKAFSFSQYSEWPDSRKLDRPLRFLRKRKLIIGNPQTLFSLTNSGKEAAEEIAKTFSQRKLFK